MRSWWAPTMKTATPAVVSPWLCQAPLDRRPAGRLGDASDGHLAQGMERSLAAPAASLLALEQLAIAEFGAFLASSPLLRLLGRGDEHPVLGLVGFTGDDHSTRPLRWFLRSQGYWVHGWGLGREPRSDPERSSTASRPGCRRFIREHGQP